MLEMGSCPSTVLSFFLGQFSLSFGLILSDDWKTGYLPSATKGKEPGVYWFVPKPHLVPGGKTWTQRTPSLTHLLRSLSEGEGTKRDSVWLIAVVGKGHCYLSLVMASSCGTVTDVCSHSPPPVTKPAVNCEELCS